MKTAQEILDFYGVELNKVYKKKDEEIYFKISINRVRDLIIIYSRLVKEVESYCIDVDSVNPHCNNAIIFGSIALLNDWDFAEYKEPILDNKEKEYLSAVIRPFRDRVINIAKLRIAENYNYISIKIKSKSKDLFFGEDIELPVFKADTMYKGMKIRKWYTIKDLDL